MPCCFEGLLTPIGCIRPFLPAHLLIESNGIREERSHNFYYGIKFFFGVVVCRILSGINVAYPRSSIGDKPVGEGKTHNRLWASRGCFKEALLAQMSLTSFPRDFKGTEETMNGSLTKSIHDNRFVSCGTLILTEHLVQSAQHTLQLRIVHRSSSLVKNCRSLRMA